MDVRVVDEEEESSDEEDEIKSRGVRSGESTVESTESVRREYGHYTTHGLSFGTGRA